VPAGSISASRNFLPLSHAEVLRGNDRAPPCPVKPFGHSSPSCEEAPGHSFRSSNATTTCRRLVAAWRARPPARPSAAVHDSQNLGEAHSRSPRGGAAAAGIGAALVVHGRRTREGLSTCGEWTTAMTDHGRASRAASADGSNRGSRHDPGPAGRAHRMHVRAFGGILSTRR